MPAKPKQGFFIELENPARSYFPGQVIAGRIVVQHSKPCDVKFISITFGGLAKIHWVESKLGASPTEGGGQQTAHYEATEQYFACKIILFGNESGSAVTIPKGVSFYPFQFTLPLNLPSSFSGNYGTVHYLMEAYMKKKSSKKDIVSKLPFTVNGILDLNTEPGVNESVDYQKQKGVGSCCCKSGPVGYKIKLPCTGFVPGQFVDFSGEFTNMSRRKVKHVQLTLLQYVTFNANGKSKLTVQELGTAFSRPILKGDSEHWGGHVFKIPPVAPTRLGNCRIIDVQYKLKFEMVLKGATKNLNVEIPITIGTIPFLRDFNDLIHNADAAHQQHWSSIVGFSGDFSGNTNQPIVNPPILQTYPNLPPPTYQEVMENDAGKIAQANTEVSTEKTVGESNEAFASDPDPTDDTNDAYETQPRFTEPFVPNYLAYGFL